MIRYRFINNEVLKLFRRMPDLSFPLPLKDVVKLIPNCKCMSYQKFAELNHCTVRDVIVLCNSQSGATTYDVATNRYLILYNAETTQLNNRGRQRWTIAHEIGHVVLGHMNSCDSGVSGIISLDNKDFEREADCFAATLLAPFPIISEMPVDGFEDLMLLFDLSATAAGITYEKYRHWCNFHYVTAWENDIKKIYRSRRNHSVRV